MPAPEKLGLWSRTQWLPFYFHLSQGRLLTTQACISESLIFQPKISKPNCCVNCNLTMGLFFQLKYQLLGWGGGGDTNRIGTVVLWESMLALSPTVVPI